MFISSKKYSAALIILILSSVIPEKGNAMGLLDIFKVYQASEFFGVLTDNGKPLAGVNLERKVEENDSFVTTQKTTTDENGKFYFPSVYRYGLTRFSIAENRYFQEITTVKDNEKIQVFYVAKNGVALNDEISYRDGNKEVKRSLKFSCDFNNKNEYSSYRNSSFLGICRFIE